MFTALREYRPPQIGDRVFYTTAIQKDADNTVHVAFVEGMVTSSFMCGSKISIETEDEVISDVEYHPDPKPGCWMWPIETYVSKTREASESQVVWC